MITKIFSYMKGGDNSKKDKEIGRHGDKVKIIRVSAPCLNKKRNNKRRICKGQSLIMGSKQ